MDAEKIDLLRRTIIPAGTSDDDAELFIETCERLKLDPFARQVFAVQRNVKEGYGDRATWKKVTTVQVSIDGFRLVAERTGKYAGQLGPFWTADGEKWLEVWLSKEPPRAAKVSVLRSDFKEPLTAVAEWDAYKQSTNQGLAPMWTKMGPLMLAKCAESLALRRAFPNELSGVYTVEEMSQATPVAATPTEHAGTTLAKPGPADPAIGVSRAIKQEAEPPPSEPQSSPEMAPSESGDTGEALNAEGVKAIRDQVKRLTWKPDYARKWLTARFGVANPEALSMQQGANSLVLLNLFGKPAYDALLAEMAAKGEVRA